jgi:hypothetical protein
MRTIGFMTMPVDFKYKKAHHLGRPRHEKYSDFWRRHTPMDHVRRAKLFSPFDALRGFDEAVESKNIRYVERSIPADLNEKLRRLQELSRPVTIRFFVPCTDENNEAFEKGLGLYKTVNGTVRDINPVTETLRINETLVNFEDIGEITEDSGSEK